MKSPQNLLTFGLCAAALAVLPFSARAQTPAAAPAAPAAKPNARASQPVEVLLKDMSKDTSITVVADSSVAPIVVSLPAETVASVTPDTLEASLTNITRRLPAGTQWVKLMLPELPGSRTYKGDDVADYALAQARLFGNIGAPPPPGRVEIMGQKIGTSEAAPVLSALNLKPVYVVINAAARASGAAMPSGNWSKLTPDQQKSYAMKQAEAIKNMSPAQRTEMMQQQRAVMGAYFQSMSPDERRQMFQSMGGGNRGNRGNRGGGNGK